MAPSYLYRWNGESAYHMMHYHGWALYDLAEMLGTQRTDTIYDWRYKGIDISHRYKVQLQGIAEVSDYPYTTFFSRETGEPLDAVEEWYAVNQIDRKTGKCLAQLKSSKSTKRSRKQHSKSKNTDL